MKILNFAQIVNLILSKPMIWGKKDYEYFHRIISKLSTVFTDDVADVKAFIKTVLGFEEMPTLSFKKGNSKVTVFQKIPFEIHHYEKSLNNPEYFIVFDEERTNKIRHNQCEIFNLKNADSILTELINNNVDLDFDAFFVSRYNLQEENLMKIIDTTAYETNGI